MTFLNKTIQTRAPQQRSFLFVMVVVDLSQSILENIIENKNKSCK
jgi:hypothetical protein